MTMRRRWILAFGCILMGCIQSCTKLPRPPSQAESFAAKSADLFEDTVLLDVATDEANMAFLGNPDVAMSVAESFADAEKFEEAKYWYQIAAENGNPQAKQALAILLRKKNCRRAIFWLESYLAEGADVIGIEPYIQTQESLKVYRKECATK